MSYFSADERLERNEAAPPAPYNLRLTEVDEGSTEIGLAWQRSLGRVEGYLILVQRRESVVQSRNAESRTLDGGLQTLDYEEWRTVLRVMGREKSAARVRLPNEVWDVEGAAVVVVAFCGELLSNPSNQVTFNPRRRAPTVIRSVLLEIERVEAGRGVNDPVSSVNPVEEARPVSTEEASHQEEVQLAGWAEIEEALRRNSAALGRHGLFVRGDS